MSSKEEKPTLAGVTVKTRKRNIVIPVDPGSFADAVVQIVSDALEGKHLSEDLEAATKALDAAEIEYSRYGDTLFEVLFAGGRLATGASLAEGGSRLADNILACKPERDAIVPFVKLFQSLTRRRPFLVRGLENTLIKLLLSLEFFDEIGRRKIAIALALVFSFKIAVVAENVLNAFFTDRLVVKGTMLDVVTVFFQEYLAKDSLDDLVALLVKGKAADRLLELLPPIRRSPEEFAAHFKAANLGVLVEWATKRHVDVKVTELAQSLRDMITADPPSSCAEVLAHVKARKAEAGIPDSEVLRVVWGALAGSVTMTGRNGQQILQNILGKIKTYHKLLSTYATTGKLELSLLVNVQVYCYEDNRLLKIFKDIVRLLYDAEIVGEDTILHWYKKGSHPKGRNVFLADMEPFIKWLEEAEEEEDD